ncbi:hypothetical protein GALMADRAFT_248106 [Galerina marginata CBS 339.88]|uniref:Uncharacterized protein n=1 Tax=Galerina marginata (strain CBS 339.88) TaxID=685588 RepID=A0A067SXI2_GALM3|nr:hypothetical protein GALMADRAFT_248106 [Galerina marginata CBS 339.88]
MTHHLLPSPPRNILHVSNFHVQETRLGPISTKIGRQYATESGGLPIDITRKKLLDCLDNLFKFSLKLEAYQTLYNVNSLFNSCERIQSRLYILFNELAAASMISPSQCPNVHFSRIYQRLAKLNLRLSCSLQKLKPTTDPSRLRTTLTSLRESLHRWSLRLQVKPLSGHGRRSFYSALLSVKTASLNHDSSSGQKTLATSYYAPSIAEVNIIQLVNLRNLWLRNVGRDDDMDSTIPF